MKRNRHNGLQYLLMIAWVLLSLNSQADSPQPSTIEDTGAETRRLNINHLPSQPLGHYIDILQESDSTLTLSQVTSLYASGLFHAATNEVLSFGIGAPAVWLHLSVVNESSWIESRQLVFDLPWLDDIQVNVVHQNFLPYERFQVGDQWPFEARPEKLRAFYLPLQLPPGSSDIYIRIATDDPMVAPVYLLQEQQKSEMLEAQNYSYALVYGYLFALILYNVILALAIGNTSGLFYALYLGCFVLMNMSYTGHGYRWIWPDATEFQRWSPPLTMILFGSAGLLFANQFLGFIRQHPRIFKSSLALSGVTLGALALSFIFNAQSAGLYTAFIFAAVFTCLLLAMGVFAWHNRLPTAKYFLLAAIAGIIGTGMTTVTVWGIIPYTELGYRAVEIGMLIEATMLALALAAKLRLSEKERQEAKYLAEIDPLTGLNNRRAFYRQAGKLWEQAILHQHSLSAVVIDIDHFKQLNDSYGHACGDQILKLLAATISAQVRKGDIAVRWGGEEFIILLNRTSLDEAGQLAERLRMTIEHMAVEDMEVEQLDAVTSFTISLGVAEMQPKDTGVDDLIKRSDKALYQAKASGRNRTMTLQPG